MKKAPDAFRTISEVAEWLEVQAHVLRFWESKFTQVKPVKRAGGRRYYRPADMVLIGGIKSLLHDEGMTIKGVQKILREKGVEYVSSLSKPLDLTEGTDIDEIDGTAQENAEQIEETANVVTFHSRMGRTVEPATSSETDTPAPETDPEPEPAEEPVGVAAPDVPLASTTEPEPTEPEPEPGEEEDESDQLHLPSFLHRSARPAPEPEPDPEPEPEIAETGPPKPRIVDAPDPPPEEDIIAAPGPLGRLAQIAAIPRDRLDALTALAAEIRQRAGGGDGSGRV